MREKEHVDWLICLQTLPGLQWISSVWHLGMLEELALPPCPYCGLLVLLDSRRILHLTSFRVFRMIQIVGNSFLFQNPISWCQAQWLLPNALPPSYHTRSYRNFLDHEHGPSRISHSCQSRRRWYLDVSVILTNPVRNNNVFQWSCQNPAIRKARQCLGCLLCRSFDCMGCHTTRLLPILDYPFRVVRCAGTYSRRLRMVEYGTTTNGSKIYHDVTFGSTRSSHFLGVYSFQGEFFVGIR